MATKTAKKATKKTATKKTSSSGLIHHKAYSYINKKGKTVHVAAHTERKRSK